MWRVSFDENNHLLPYKAWQDKTDFKNTIPPSFLNFSTSGGGVLYPPHTLHHDIFNEKIFMPLAPLADDIFFWAMAVLNNIKINRIDEYEHHILNINPQHSSDENKKNTLFYYNGAQGQNDVQLKNIFNHYPTLKEKLLTAYNEESNSIEK